MRPDDLLTHAERLCRASPKRPRQVDLRRAVSAAYYALFHELCHVCANRLIGTGSAVATAGWRLAYRAVDHGTARKRCKALPPELSSAVGGFARAFVLLQEERHRADYDPHARFKRSEALTLVPTAREGVKSMQRAAREDRLAFAAHILFSPR